jgi:hypothetical protein
VTSILRKALVGGAVAATLAAGFTAPAQARNGGAIAAGVLGGLAAGAIVGSAAANSGYYAAPAYAAPAYAPPAPAYGGCYFTRQPVYDEEGYVVGHRRVRVCD